MIRGASFLVVAWIGLQKTEYGKKNEPRWKCRIRGYIKMLRQEVKFLEKESKEELGLKKNGN